MSKLKSIPFAMFLTFAALMIVSSAYTLPEGRQALITQFGRIVGTPITKAGLHFKVPFIQDVRLFDKRILEWDGDSNQVPTKDKKFIWVDTTARWRIIDAVKFAQTVRTEDAAKTRLDSILDGATRDIISKHNLVEAVRNTNTLLDQAKKRKEIVEDLASGPEQTGPAAQSSGRITIGWGRQDRLCLPRQAARAQAAFPSATVHWFASSGHFPAWDMPDETIAVILAATHSVDNAD